METRFLQCRECGAELDFATGLCPYCPSGETAASDAPVAVEETLALAEDDDPFVLSEDMPIAAPLPVAPSSRPAAVAAPAPVPMAVATPVPEPLDPWPETPVHVAAPTPAVPDGDRVFGLVLFDAEEEIARGNLEKAMVLASRAVKERPDNLTARALYERARRELVAGRRRDKLDARVREAERLARLGDAEGATRIVVSALKFVPDHPLALKLYARLRDARLAHDTAEAEAERELDGLMRQQARQALDASRADLAGRRERQALVSIRRALRLVPDDPELLAHHQEVNARLAFQQTARFRHHALQAQTRDGLELLSEGRFEDAERVLRAVVAEQPANTRAAAALEQAIQREAPAPRFPVTVVAPAPLAAPLPVVEKTPTPPAPQPERPTPAPAPVRAVEPPRPARPPTPAPAPAPALVVSARVTAPASVPLSRSLPPPELRVSRPPSPTPLPYVFGGAALLAAVLAFVLLRGDGAPEPTVAATLPVTTAPATTVAAAPSGPLAGLGADARQAVEKTLEQYVLALESRDPDRLELARPDLVPEERQAVLAPLAGAITVSPDVQVLDVTVEGDGFAVTILRTLVVVGGDGSAPARTEETLRFTPVDGAWRVRRR